jgi:hypothetical protein
MSWKRCLSSLEIRSQPSCSFGRRSPTLLPEGTPYPRDIQSSCKQERPGIPSPWSVRCRRLLGATPFLQYIAYPLDMMEHVIRLHLDHEPDRHSFNLPVPFAKCDSTIPRFRYSLQELKDVFPGGLQERQRRIKGSRAICPPISPCLL